ncbi:GEVED domain-containing protein [Flavobacterium sp.]|uniref:Ig-like domain-containing protein n=1 Tax=Flavobacterium sp. TaxID=239 RepID=UPI0039E6B613
MIINYNSLGGSRDTLLKNDVGDLTGSPPGGSWRSKLTRWLACMIVFLSLTTSQLVKAQSIANYVFSTSTTGSLEDLTTGATSIMTGNNDSASTTVQPIGFDFWFMGVRYTHFSANSNGQVKLHTSAGDTAIGTTGITSYSSGVNTLAAFSGDNEVNNGMLMKVIGTAPNRKLVIEWTAFYVGWSFSLTNAGNMQAWLSEGSNAIDYVYGAIYNANSSTAARGVYIASSNTATTAGHVVIGASPTFVPNATLATTTFAAGSGTTTGSPLLSDIGSLTNGSRRVYTFTPTTPTAPSGLNFTAITATGMTLNWADNSANETGFSIYRSTDGINYTLITTTAANAITYNATGLSVGTNYFWRVNAIAEVPSAATSASASTTAGTLSGLKTIGTGGDYDNLTQAFAAINSNGLAGNIELRLATGYPATPETYPIVGSNTASVGTFNVKVYPIVSGLSITSNNATGTLNLNNSSKVTIDGRVNQTGPMDLVIANTNAGTSYAVQFVNDASNNVIKYCSIQSANTSVTSGTIVFGTTTGTGGNDNNSIENCDIKDSSATPANGIYSAGTTTNAGTYNDNNTVTNCNIYNFFSAGNATNGILVASGNAGWTITGNSVYQTASRTYTTGNTHTAINITNGSGGSGYTISGNFIGGTAASAGSTAYTMGGTVATLFRGITLSAGTGTVSNVQNNVVRNIALTTSSGTTTSPGIFSGINITAGTVNVGTVTGNTIGSSTGNGSITVTSTTSGGWVTGIVGASAGSLDVRNNTVASITATGGATIGYVVYGIYFSGSPTARTVSNNNIGSATANSISIGAAASTGTSTFTGIYESGTPTTLTMNNNIVRGNTIFTAIATMHCLRATTTQATVSGNQVFDNAITATGSGGTSASILYGYYNFGSPTVENLTNNQIYNLSMSVNNTAAATSNMVAGFYTNTTASAVKNISGNTFYNLNYSNATTGSATVYGIRSLLGAPTNIFKNKVYGLTASTGAGSIVNGISVESGTTNNIYNNLVGGLTATASGLTAPAASVVGLNFSGTTGTFNAYNNTIHVTGAGGTNFGSAAVYANTGSTVNLRNNIFSNQSTPNGTGKAIAYQRSSTTLGTYDSASNRNLLYAGTPGANNLIYFDGTNSDQTLAAFKIRMVTRDQASVTELPTFVSTTGSDATFLHINTSTPTYAEGGGASIAIVTDDFDGDARNATTPDIGADEFAGAAIGCTTAVAGTISSGPTSFCVTGTPTITATGFSSGSGTTYLWQSSADPGFASPVDIGSPSGAYTNLSPTVTANTSYRLKVECVNGALVSYSNVISFTVNSPTLVSTTPGTRCGAGTVSLQATAAGADTVMWYANASGGTSLATGSPFVTPSITGTTTFYVAASTPPTSYSLTVGGDTTLTSATEQPTAFCNRWTNYKGQYVFTPAELNAAGIYGGQINSIAFNITTLGDAATNSNFIVSMGTVASTTLTTTYITGLTQVYGPVTYTHAVGINTINLTTPYNWDGVSNLVVDVSHAGANATNNSVTYYTATAGNTVIYSTTGTIGTTGSLSNKRLNITFNGVSACVGSRQPIVATINPAPALTLSTSTANACAGGSSSLVTITSNVADFDTYSWSPSTGVSGTAATGYTFSPSVSTNYILTASQTSGSLCTNTASVLVSVVAAPTITSATATPATICSGQVSTLTAATPSVAFPNYAFTGSAGTYTPISGTATTAIGDDFAQGNLPIGFTFNYNGNPYTVFAASSNGFIELGSTLSYVNNTESGWLPSTNALATRANIIAPFWDDNNTVGGSLQYLTTGSAGNRVLTVQWTDMHVGSTGSTTSPTLSMQLRLYEATGGIEFIYGPRSATLTAGASVGYSGAVGTYRSMTPASPPSASTSSTTTENTTVTETNLPSGTTYSFVPATPATITWSPTANLYTDAAATIAYTGTVTNTVYAKLTAPATYTATATNTANCSSTQNVSVTLGNPTVADITGDSSVCLPNTNTITLSNPTPTGVWSSSDVEIATVSPSGIVTPVAEGTVTISYTVTADGCSTVKTHEVAVNAPVEITSSTPTQTTTIGGNTSFVVVATGTGTPGLTYQWQVNTDETGETFDDVVDGGVFSGANTATLSLTDVPASFNNYFFQCIVTGACNTVISDLAILIVGETGIIEHPQPPTVCDNGAAVASFTVVGSPDVETYQWQEDQGGDNWQNLSNGGIYSGVDTATLTLTGVTSANDNWRYKVIVTGNGTAESNPATLNVVSAATIDTDPTAQYVCYTGGSTSFNVAASGDIASYVWQYSTSASGPWNTVANGTPVGASYTGAATATLNVTTTAATPTAGTYFYRTIVNSAAPCGPATSGPAQMMINTPSITTPPANASVNAGASTSFTVSANTIGAPAYAWEYATATGGPWTAVANGTPAGVTYTGTNTATLGVVTTTAAAASTARYYRAIVSSPVGCSVTSASAQLTIVNYCTPVAATSTSSYFNGFSTTGGVSNISNPTTGFSTSGYGNFIAQGASQYQGDPINFSAVLVGTSVGVAIWVDWNQDLVFDASERMYNTSTFTSTTPHNGTFTVPAGALPGTTRMRILMDFNTGSPANPCGPFGSGRGEVEDYSFTVLVKPACTGNPVAGTISASQSQLCLSGTSVLTATGYAPGVTGVTIQWHDGNGPISGATNPTFTTPTLTTTTSYFLRVTCTNGGGFSDTAPVTITVNNPSVTGITPGARCGTGTVALSATGSAGTTLNWYAASSGGASLFTGANFTTPSISTTTNYYVDASTGGGSVTMGPASPTAQGGTIGSQTVAWNINFNVLAATTIQSVTIYPSTSGQNGVITVRQGTSTTGTVVSTTNYTTNVSGGATPQVIVLNTPLTPGTYNLYTDTLPTGGINRNTTGAVYPVTSAVASITGNGFDQNYWMGLYSWVFSNGCTSARTMVTATVNTAPAFTLSSSAATICSGSSTPVVNVTSNVADYDTYVWTPATGVSGTAATGFTFNPSVSTNYTLNVSQSSGSQCTNSATFNVTVNPTPVTPVISQASTTICNGDIVPLNIGTSSTTSAAVTFGTGTTAPGTTSFPNPFSAWYGGAKHQMIITASELTAQGLVAGSSITSVGFNISAFVNAACTNFTIRMGNTALNALTGFVTGTTAVYGPTTFTPTATGVVNFTLTTPFTWNGTSNIIVETIHNAGNSGNGSGTRALTTTTATNTVFYGAKDSVAGGISGFDGAAPYTNTGASNLRPNIRLGFTASLIPSWSPAAGLYTDAGATVPYVSGPAATVYAKPATTSSYTATVSSSAGCPATSAATTITVNQFYPFYVDVDGDHYGTGAPVSLCAASASTPPTGYAAVGGDCNDAVAAINPGHAEVLYNGVDDNCDGNLDEGNQLVTQLLAASCGATLTSIGSLIGIQTIAPASTITRWRIRATNGAQVQTIETNVPHFTMPQFPSYAYATTYTIAIELQRNGVWLGYYGPNCFVSTPAILEEGGAAAVSPSQCGITLPKINTLIATTSIQGVTGYRFRVTNLTDVSGPNAVQTIDRTQNWFSLQMLTRYNYGTTYRIEVAVKTTGTYGGYGSPCEVSSPAVPSLVNCGGVATSGTQTIAATSVSGATQYRFQITRQSDNASTTIDRSTNYFVFNAVPSSAFTAGALYTVRVAVMTTGTWSPFGDACEITAPGGTAKVAAGTGQTSSDLFRAQAMPNPFTADFGIDVTTSNKGNVQLMVYDMLGKLIESREVKLEDLSVEKIGSNYPSGVYNVIVTQDNVVKTLRVIKR